MEQLQVEVWCAVQEARLEGASRKGPILVNRLQDGFGEAAFERFNVKELIDG